MYFNKLHKTSSIGIVLVLLLTTAYSAIGYANNGEIILEYEDYTVKTNEEKKSINEDVNVKNLDNSKKIFGNILSTDGNESSLESFKSSFMRQLYEFLSRFLDKFPMLASLPFFSSLLDLLNDSQDPGDVSDTTPPFQVTGLSVIDAKDGKLDLSWDVASDNVGVDHYCVCRDDGILIADDLEVTTYLDSGLINGISYTYHVSAVDAAGNEGELSDAVDGIPTESILDDTIPPSQVTGLTVIDAKDGKLDLSWDAASDNVGVDFYRIYRDSTFLAEVSGLNYLDSGLTNDQSYSYQVSAVDTSGNEGEKSSSVSATPTEALNDVTILPESGHIMLGGNGYLQINTTIDINGTLVTLNGTIYLNTGIEYIHIWWNLTTGFFKINASSFNPDGTEEFEIIDFFLEIKDSITNPKNILTFYFNFVSMDGGSCLVLNNQAQTGMLGFNGKLKIGKISGQISINSWQNITLQGSFYADNYKEIKGEASIEWDFTEEQPLVLIQGNLTNDVERYFNVDDLLFEIENTIHLSAEKINFSSKGHIEIGDYITIAAEIENANIENLYFAANGKSISLNGDFNLVSAAEVYIKTDPSLENLELKLFASATLIVTGFDLNLNNGLIVVSCNSFELSGYGSVLVGNEIILDATITKFDVSSLHVVLNSNDLMISGNFNLNATARIFVKTDFSLKKFEIYMAAGGSLTITGLNVNLNNGALKATCFSIVISGSGSVHVGNDIVFDATLTSVNIDTLHVEINSKKITLSGTITLTSAAKIYVKTDFSLKKFEIYMAAGGSLTITGFNLNMNSGAVVVSFHELTISGHGSLKFDDNIILDASLTYVYMDTFYAYATGEKITVSGTFSLNAAGTLYIKTDLSSYVEFQLNSGYLTVTGLIVDFNDEELYLTANDITLTAGGTGYVRWDEEKLTVDGSGTITLDITTLNLYVDTSTVDISLSIPTFYASIGASAEELVVYFNDDNGGGGGGGDPVTVIVKGDIAISGSLEITLKLCSVNVGGEAAAKIDVSFIGSGNLDIDNFLIDMPIASIGQTEISWTDLHLNIVASGQTSIIKTVSSKKIKIETVHVSGYLKNIGIDLKDISLIPKITITQVDLYVGGDITISWDTESFSKYILLESQNGSEIKIIDLTIAGFKLDLINALDIGSQSSFEFQWQGNDYYKQYDLLFDGNVVLGQLKFTLNGVTRDLTIGEFTGTNAHIKITKYTSDAASLEFSGSGSITGIDYDGPYLTLEWVSLDIDGNLQTNWFDHDTIGSGTLQWTSSNGFDGSFNFQTTLFKNQNIDLHLHGDIDFDSTNGQTHYFQWDILGNWHPDGWCYIAAYLPGSSSDPAINSYNFGATINGHGPKFSGQNVWQEGETYLGTYYETFLRKWLPLLPITIGEIHGNNNKIYTTENNGATWAQIWPVGNEAPVAIIGSNVEDNSPYEIGETFHCDAFNSYDPDGDIVSYSWSFGDGDTATGDFVEHSYSAPGEYTITLTVEDDDGLTDTGTAFVTVNNNLNPEVLLEVYMLSGDGTTWEYKGNSDDPEVDVFVGRSIKFDPKYPTNTYDPDGDIEQYRWYAHDNGGYGPWESGHPSPRTYSWGSTGYHGVRLDVKDDDGAQNNADINLHVISPPPGTIKGNVYKSSGGALSGATVSTDGDSDTTDFLGRYELTVDPGSHIVTASKSGYQSDSQTVSVDPDETVNNVDFYLEITNSPPNKPSIPTGPTTGNTGTRYYYNTATTDPNGDDVRYGWDWDGDSTVDQWTSYYSSGSSVQYSHTWYTAGTYYVKVKAEDEHGAQSSFSTLLTVAISDVPTPEWVTPNGHYPSSGWDDEGKARDGSIESSAESEKFMLTDEGWTDWLELTITPYISCSKVRYYALYSSTYITKIDIEVYYSSDWHHIYAGSFANEDWQSRLLGGTYTVSKAKVRFYVKGAWNGGEGITAELFEFQFWKVD